MAKCLNSGSTIDINGNLYAVFNKAVKVNILERTVLTNDANRFGNSLFHWEHTRAINIVVAVFAFKGNFVNETGSETISKVSIDRISTL
jgi:hypothetical protein